MREIGLIPELVEAGVSPMDLPEEELLSHPDDPVIPHLLLDDSTEQRLAASGNQRAAYLLRKQRKHLYRVWLSSLSRLKFDISSVRMRARRDGFEEICRFEWRVVRGLVKLRMIGFLHFHGITHKWDQHAVEAARDLVLCVSPDRGC